MEPILRGLNEAQRAAVTSSASVLQVLAPPGSGKTKTLTSRVAYLLAQHGYAPWNVICCTFTVKASREMRERLRGMIGDGMESRLIIGTFHSICRRYLVRYGRLINVPKNFGIADSDDSLNIVKRIVKRLKLGIDPKTARSRISQCKSRGQTLADLPQNTKTIEAQEFATIFNEYESALSNSSLLDYDDLLLRCVDLLEQYPNCVANVEALLIDEFQDTNVVQYELMKLLSNAKKRITIVGDPDQSIYGFRSAEIENLQLMKVYYPETVVINLEENYRSSSAILQLAQEVIEQDFSRPEKQLKSTHRRCTLPVLRRLPNPYQEAQWIAAEIRRIMTMTGNMIQHNDIAILLRSAFLSLHIEKALASVGIPYRMVGGRRFFDRVEIRVIIDYLRTIGHPENNSALLAIINTPKRKVGEATVKELSHVAQERNEPLWTVLQKVLSGQIPTEKKMPRASEQGLRDLVRLVKQARQTMEDAIPSEVPHKLIEYIVSSLKYEDFLKRSYPEDHEDRWENVKELMTQAKDAMQHLDAKAEDLPEIEGILQDKPGGSEEMLSQFLANILLSPEVEDESAGTQSTVTISTIHSAKGLEWPVVFIPAVYEGSIPHSRAENLDEERRLLYVAMTRAKVLLYMTFPVSQNRDGNWGGESVLSKFLPTDILPFTSELGPVFDDRLVTDIANVIGRQEPFHEDLARALRKMKDNESAEDDIWPSDGTHRVGHGPSDSDDVDNDTQPGRKVTKTIRSTAKHTSGKTLVPDPDLTIKTGRNSSDCSGVKDSGFTTANIYLQNNAEILKSEHFCSNPANADENQANKTTKKPKLTKALSNQSNINSFFTISTPKISQTISIPALNFDQQIRLSDLQCEDQIHPGHMYKKDDKTIPLELAKHRFGDGSVTFKHPRAALTVTRNSENVRFQKRNHYTAFSSSPDREHTNDIHRIEQREDNEPDDNACDSPTQTYNISTTIHTGSDDDDDEEDSYETAVDDLQQDSALVDEEHEHEAMIETNTTITTTISQLKNRDRSSQSQNSYKGIRSGGTNTAQGQQQNRHVSTTSVVTTIQQLQSTGGTGVNRYRTLGVRRSMNGWAARKHK